MADLQSTHTQALKLVLSLRSGVERLELADQPGRYGSLDSLFNDLERQLEHLNRLSHDMESQWRMQSLQETPARREVWRRKVETVGEEAAALGSALHRWRAATSARLAETAQRSELLGGGGVGAQQGGPHSDAASRRHLSNSKRVLEEAYATGVGVLSGMSSQRETLKSAQRRLLDVINSVGLSDSLLRLADRRQRLDQVIAYGGMVATVILVALLYWYLKM